MGIKEEAATLSVLGVDVSKERLDAALLKEGGEFAERAFGNSPAGWGALLEWARGRGGARPVPCVEASGGYELDLCVEAHRGGYRVLQVCALRTSNFRKSLHLRNKTDTDDARLLCRFALHMRLCAWLPPAPKVRELKELVLVRSHAVKEADKHRDLTGKMRTAAGRRTANAFAREAEKVTIAAVYAVGDLGRFDDVHQFAAFAGIHPGRRPDLRNKQIICPCAHKLLRIIFGVVKSRRPFEHSPGG